MSQARRERRETLRRLANAGGRPLAEEQAHLRDVATRMEIARIKTGVPIGVWTDELIAATAEALHVSRGNVRAAAQRSAEGVPRWSQPVR
ncbi:MAG: hypothetical protein AB7R89_11115 [Dehalococcoidia bacterium]